MSSSSGSHSLVLAPGASSPALSSTPDIDAAAQGGGGAKAASRKEMDSLNPASGIREDILATPILPPQPPPPPPVNDGTFADFSRSSLHSEHTGPHDVDVHGRDDIV